jgi:hypothetical protein
MKLINKQMPNTLAHIGIQSFATRRILKDSDYLWIFIGCVIPDIPWILGRLVATSIKVDLYVLRIYAIIQSSFLFCLILSFALASLSKRYWKTFIILSLNSIFHLLLDGLQIKWGNGVHFFAPFDWHYIKFGLFWPESLLTHTLTGFGFIYFWISWRKSTTADFEFEFRPRWFFPLLTVYFFLPVLFLPGPLNADNHFIKTLQSGDMRKGNYIEIDRGFLTKRADKHVVTTFAGEELIAEGIDKDISGVVSIKGKFTSNNLIKISDYHFHLPMFRDLASYIGLSLILLYCCYSIVLLLKARKKLRRRIE